MDMSLEEIIKNRRSSYGRGRRGGGRQGSSRGFGGASNFQSNEAAGRGGGGDGPMCRDRSLARRSNAFSPYYNIHKIVISNLDSGVTSTDITDLFDEFGPLKTATVHYDTSGRSLGTAEVVFGSKNAALKALRRYNNLPLDGRRMKIELATDLLTVANLANRLNRPASLLVQGIGVGARGYRGDRGITRGHSSGQVGDGGGRGGRSNGKELPSKDELDAQLDNFMKSKNN